MLGIIKRWLAKILWLHIQITFEVDEINTDNLYKDSKQYEETKKLLLNSWRININQWNQEVADSIKQIYEWYIEWYEEIKKNSWQN